MERDPEGFLPLGLKVHTKHVLRDLAVQLSKDGERLLGQHRIVSAAVRDYCERIGKAELVKRIPEDPDLEHRACPG